MIIIAESGQYKIGNHILCLDLAVGHQFLCTVKFLGNFKNQFSQEIVNVL